MKQGKPSGRESTSPGGGEAADVGVSDGREGQWQDKTTVALCGAIP